MKVDERQQIGPRMRKMKVIFEMFVSEHESESAAISRVWDVLSQQGVLVVGRPRWDYEKPPD